MKDDKKKFKDTKVGQWLQTKAPAVLDGVSELTPDAGLLGVVADALRGQQMPEEDMLEFEKLAKEAEMEAQRQVTARWEADTKTAYWLPNNIRPVSMITLMVSTLVFIALDSFDEVPFTLSEGHLDLLQYLGMTVFGAYFAGRSWEKTRPQ